MTEFLFLYSELYISIIILAVTFFLLKMLDLHTLFAIIIIIIIGYLIYLYLNNLNEIRNNDIKSIHKSLDNDIKSRIEKDDKSFFIHKFPKKLTYLYENEVLLTILNNIRFIKKFSNSRYGDLVINMNSLMKIYIYILSERYPVDNLEIYVDIHNNILEIMHSFIVIVPEYLKHSYGFNAYDEIEKSIHNYEKESKRMFDILYNFNKLHNQHVYVPDNFNIKPYNSLSSIVYP